MISIVSTQRMSIPVLLFTALLALFLSAPPAHAASAAEIDREVDKTLAAAGLTGMSTADASFDAPLALKLAVAQLEGYQIPSQYIIPVPTVYQQAPAQIDPGIAVSELKECTDIQAGCTVFPTGMFPDDYFVSFYFKGLPELTLDSYVTGKP